MEDLADDADPAGSDRGIGIRQAARLAVPCACGHLGRASGGRDMAV